MIYEDAQLNCVSRNEEVCARRRMVWPAGSGHGTTTQRREGRARLRADRDVYATDAVSCWWGEHAYAEGSCISSAGVETEVQIQLVAAEARR